ncbi:Non-reducing end alpha-L-arabinofuranosidase BoGH43A 6 [Colletotrichum chlorophyti]|uniref:Non-reducing end alpha-L-arabinofuranosidase BoGH43A 6 n=1 Tax=Colletotrichum chlorophyti TaxID=708187 RepID=A0A1Q8RBM1_9PEZI|nr:Non-reducing end alpha-L-arabinofuranosidase BoGH43A 6 [Colletotrichum chlorophyti]
MTKSLTFTNPILPGFYPDPSVVRVGDEFYMINSSFQFFPGLPIHKSTNLVDWELVDIELVSGHAICRPSQIDLNQATTKINRAEFGEFFTAGLYAPTIRFHAGRFYIVCTNLKGRSSMDSTEDFGPENFIITCDNLSDPNSFSDPIYFDFHGIDPSLLFDEDGKVYMQGSWIYGYRKKPATVIRQAEIDLNTGKYLSELRDIWTGSGDKVPEGPHLYKRNGAYWLLIAEGGTHRGHKITMARSDNVWGPYESYKKNPILTTQGSYHAIQCVGHGDLFMDKEGEWWCCLLGRREINGAYPLGRETYLVPATWSETAFPCLEPVELQQVVSFEHRQLPAGLLVSNSPPLPKTVRLDSPYTVYLRTPDLQAFSHDLVSHRIELLAKPMALGCAEGSPVFFGQRQVSLKSEASVTLHLDSLPADGHCGLSLYKDTFRHVSLDVNSKKEISLATAHKTHEFGFVNARTIAVASSVKLIVRSTIDSYVFSYELFLEGAWNGELELGSISAADMSGDDFTGTVYGLYASGKEGKATFEQFLLVQ